MNMEVTSNSVMQFNVFLKLTEEEARALDALVGYGFKPFLKVFYEHLGKSYMEPHEKGCQSLFNHVRSQIPQHLSRIDVTRKAFNEHFCAKQTGPIS
jgi:hypothetical protein